MTIARTRLLPPAVLFCLSWLACLGIAEARTWCEELGFSDSLDCTACDRLKSFLSGSGTDPKMKSDAEALDADCRGCCLETLVEKYDRAVLRMSAGATARDQDLEDFVRRKAPAFKTLTVEKAQVFFTTLHLLSGDQTPETAAESINVHGWKTDEIKDFLSERLKA